MDKIPRWLQVTILALLVMALVFLYLWQEWQIIHLQRKIDHLDESLTPLRERKKQLLIDEARYFSYERIERLARQRLGMVAPQTPGEEIENGNES